MDCKISDIIHAQPIEGVDFDLANRVCAALYLKRQNLAVVDIDVEKMATHFNSDKETMVKIIQWYESQLVNTKFVEK